MCTAGIKQKWKLGMKYNFHILQVVSENFIFSMECKLGVSIHILNDLYQLHVTVFSNALR